jgi:hypothetical protein
LTAVFLREQAVVVIRKNTVAQVQTSPQIPPFIARILVRNEGEIQPTSTAQCSKS